MELLQIHHYSSKFNTRRFGGNHSYVHENLAPSMCSPCGTYLCRYVKQLPTILVHDLRSGCRVLEHMVGPAVEAQGADKSYYNVAMNWSSCGCYLMIVSLTGTFRGP